MLDFQNLFLSGVPSIIYEVNLEKRKNGLCVGHLLKKNEDFFFSQLPSKAQWKKREKLDKKLHQMLVDLAKVKANVLQIKMSEIAFLICNRPDMFL